MRSRTKVEIQMLWISAAVRVLIGNDELGQTRRNKNQNHINQFLEIYYCYNGSEIILVHPTGSVYDTSALL